ncbi:MAG: NAD-dependent epimerase/dehydratase family protein [Planctomycetota bacterium]|nr:MAG: NAD-dependent epimerase/dehydratase family protein [Planctomycetota bacterium]
MAETPAIRNVMVTGATGFVGRAVVRELIARGFKPICVVRNPARLEDQHRDLPPERFSAVVGSLHDRRALRRAADVSQAAIHLVGIILNRRLQRQTFRRIHVEGTENVLEAVTRARIRRFVHMSALGTRPDAPSAYHRTKWQAEEAVRRSGLDWTVFRPSVIHGPYGELMQLLKRFVCGLLPPVIPCFGQGTARVQPVFVKDVAHCFVESLLRPQTVGQIFSLGGPQAYTWIELYETCRRIMPKAKRWKPIVSIPVPLAELLALVSAPPMAVGELLFPPLRKFRFDRGQVAMAQEDSVCDPTAAEKAFDIRMRSFEEELSAYADLIP